MTRSRKPMSRAAQAGASDGSVAALVRRERTASDAFISRRELLESERVEYSEAFYAAYAETSRAFRIGGAS